MNAGMSRFLVCTNRSSNRSTQGSPDNRTIATANLITNCCASGTANATTNCCIQGGIIRVCFNNHQ